MARILYDNPFSPFARKVRLVLSHKNLDYERKDSLAVSELADLHAVNPRGEVPVLDDDGLIVVNSSDIVAYLEHRYPQPALLPADPAVRVEARAWERLADGLIDALTHDISLWTWPTLQRHDQPPPGLVEAGMRDIGIVLSRLEKALDGREYLCGSLSIADFALFPHLTSLRALGISLQDHRNLSRWNVRMRDIPAVREDLELVKNAVREKFVDAPSPYEREKVVWRGDRIEWLIRNGFADWWYDELRAGRAVVPSSLE
ncbi:MAG TPA: glutathione S-transferase family protein [Candidatus Limnocylindrales bacterium]|nr:glutathione S-transferase family protein [Candidatus Limnocylindrales bacterium]